MQSCVLGSQLWRPRAPARVPPTSAHVQRYPKHVSHMTMAPRACGSSAQPCSATSEHPKPRTTRSIYKSPFARRTADNKQRAHLRCG